MSMVRMHDLSAPARVRCDQPGCRRWTVKDSAKWEEQWEVWGTAMHVFDFCSEHHFRAFYRAHPEWHAQ